MPDIVPNELNYETNITYTNVPAETGEKIVKLEFPKLVSSSERTRIVNVITDVEYDFPPIYTELTDMSGTLDAAAATELIYRDWVLGLYREQPTSTQIDPTDPDDQLTEGNPTVVDRNVFVELITPGVNSATAVAIHTLAGQATVRKNLQYLGVGSIIANPYVWLAMRHRRVQTTAFTAAVVRVGCRIKYVQTTIPLEEWVGLYFSHQQIGDV